MGSLCTSARLLLVATMAIISQPGIAASPGGGATRGEQVFIKHCATCHGASGAGIEPWYPSLKRLATMREPANMVETVLTGAFRRGGELNGHTIPIMPAWGQLTDAEIAALVNYIQLTWGEGGQVSVTDVTSVRAQLWEID